MSSMLKGSIAPIPPNGLMTWWPVLMGLALLFVPTYIELANTLWNKDETAHGPMVLAVALYLIWRARSSILIVPTGSGATRQRPRLGWSLLIIGLLLYVVGRAHEILMFEVGSQILVLIGVLLITVGASAVKALWFPLFFLIFMVPLPGFVLDAATVPLKHQVSVIAEQLLYVFGYPIARNGVVLHVGPYQLLVADACSGLHSMFSLSAMGLLYLHLMRHASWARNAIMIAAILPMAFAANIVRVMILVLVTYHLGDAAAQGFVHDFAGVLLFVVGLLLLFGLDALLGFLFPDRSPAGAGKLQPPTKPDANGGGKP